MPSAEDRERASALVREALALHHGGDLAEAARLYRRSIVLCPTAEAHTYLGWVLGAHGRLDAAIAECEVAIRLDPELGNPYNDIGVYLMQKGDADGAVGWLERAKRAPRYAARHYPCLNLGQIFAAKGMLRRALREFEAALTLAPGDRLARYAIRTISRRLH